MRIGVIEGEVHAGNPGKPAVTEFPSGARHFMGSGRQPRLFVQGRAGARVFRKDGTELVTLSSGERA